MPLSADPRPGGLQRPLVAVRRYPDEHAGKDAGRLGRGSRTSVGQQVHDEHVPGVQGLICGRRDVGHRRPLPSDTQLEGGRGGRDAVRPPLRDDGAGPWGRTQWTGPQRHPRSGPLPPTTVSKIAPKGAEQGSALGGGRRACMEQGRADDAREQHRGRSGAPAKGYERGLRRLDAAFSARNERPFRVQVDRRNRGGAKKMRSGPQRSPKGPPQADTRRRLDLPPLRVLQREETSATEGDQDCESSVLEVVGRVGGIRPVGAALSSGHKKTTTAPPLQ
jgi:hypothetical protein